MRIMTTLCRASRILAVSMSCNVNVRAAHNVAHVVTSTYDAIPEHLSLTNVVVIHRHGDRSQISREIGPNFPETSDIKDIWTSKLPVETTMMTMAAAAHVPTDVMSLNVKKAIFTGWDEKNIPYGQLTELGAHQLINIGRELRRRYVGSLLPSESFDASTLLYCRSTNFCRTIQSIRSLLSGLLKVDGDDYSRKSSQQLPVILSRAKNDETMFPGADGPCSAMTERRAEIFAENSMESSIPDYAELEQKMRDVLGYGDRVSWLPIKEILTCYEAHGIKFPEGVTSSFVEYVLLCLHTFDIDLD
jgi:Histidine phosphatase superfamily (branch 2)